MFNCFTIIKVRRIIKFVFHTFAIKLRSCVELCFHTHSDLFENEISIFISSSADNGYYLIKINSLLATDLTGSPSPVIIRIRRKNQIRAGTRIYRVGTCKTFPNTCVALFPYTQYTLLIILYIFMFVDNV